jgi:membrane protein DedA with SNARE-associated domain
MIAGIFRGLIDFYMTHINYGTIVLLMSIESSFIPFPSEIVIPPAAWKAAQGELDLFGVILAGIAGSTIGALVNYGLALSLGRALLYRFADSRPAHFLLIDRRAVEKAEAYFRKHGKVSTFIGRLIPAVRQLISLPAGLARMDLKDFLFYTLIGSGIWNIVLSLLGYYLYSQKELLEMYYTELSYAFWGLGFLFLCYMLWRGLKKKDPA